MSFPQTEVIIFIDDREVRRCLFALGVRVLGRSPDCDVCVEADLVSREHARLTVGEDGSLLLEDLGSTNGTFLEGQRITAATKMLPGQSIHIGVARLVVQRAGVQPEPVADLPRELKTSVRYEPGPEIAKGGMGAILSARQPSIHREVAMKVMLRDANAHARLRFVKEAQITGQLEHPNIVPVHEVAFDENDQPYYTMKLVRGITLKKIIDHLRGAEPEAIAKYPLAALLIIFQKVADAVAFAHFKGVIHRDLKPANIMVGDYGEVLVMDWGIAKLVKSASSNWGDGINGSASADTAMVTLNFGSALESSVTLDGMVLGTPQYMAPEQARGETDALDSRADIFALGAILYEILTFRAPVKGKTAAEMLDNARHDRFVPIGEQRAHRAEWRHLPGRDVPDSLAAVTMKALSPNPDERYQSVPELQADITAYQNGFATRAESPSVWRQSLLLVRRHREKFGIAAAALLLILGVSVLFVLRLRDAKNLAEANQQRAENSEKETRKFADQALAQARLAQAAEGAAEDARQKADVARAKAEAALASELKAEDAARLAGEARERADNEARVAKSGQSVAEAKAEMASKQAALASKQAALATEQSQLARAHEMEVRKSSVTAMMRDGFTASAAGDFAVAMLHFGAALQLEEDDPAASKLHRRRLALYERYSPHLLTEWPVSNAYFAAFSPVGGRLVTVGSGNPTTVTVGVVDKLLLSQLNLPDAFLGEWSADGKWLFTGGKSQSAVYNGTTLALASKFAFGADYQCRDLFALPNNSGALVSAANLNGKTLGGNFATIYDMRGRLLVSEPIDHLGTIAGVGFHDPSHFIAVFRITRLNGVGQAVGGMQLAESVDHARGNLVFKSATVQKVRGNFSAPGLDADYIPLGVSSDARWVLGTGAALSNQAALFDTKGGSIYSLNRENEKHEWSVGTFHSAIQGAAFSDGARYIATSTAKSLYLWNVENWNKGGQAVDRPQGIANTPMRMDRISFSKDASWLAGVLPSGDPLEQIHSSQDALSVENRPTGDSVWVWNLKGVTGLGEDADAPLRILRHATNVGSYQFDPTAHFIVTLSKETARLWRLEDQEPLPYQGDLGAYNLPEDFFHKQAPLDGDFASKLRPLGRGEPIEFSTVGQRIAHNKDSTLSVHIRTDAIQVFSGTMPLSPLIACPGVVNAAFVDDDNTLLLETNTGVVKYLDLTLETRPSADIVSLAEFLAARTRSSDGKITVAADGITAELEKKLRAKYGDDLQIQPHRASVNARP